jgi:hypothetical protein
MAAHRGDAATSVLNRGESFDPSDWLFDVVLSSHRMTFDLSRTCKPSHETSGFGWARFGRPVDTRTWA